MAKLTIGQAPLHLKERSAAMKVAAEWRPVGSVNLNQVMKNDPLFRTLSEREIRGQGIVNNMALYHETLDRYYDRASEDFGFKDLYEDGYHHPYIVSLITPGDTLRFIPILGVLEGKVNWGGRGHGAADPRIMVLVDEPEGKQALFPGRTWVVWLMDREKLEYGKH